MRAIRRRLLWVALAGIALTAFLGVVAVLSGHVDAKIFGTSGSITGASFLALACLPAWERRRLGPVPVIGALGFVVGFALVVVAIWTGRGSDEFWQTTATFLIVGAWATLSSLLALGQLAPRYRATFWAAVALAAVLAIFGLDGLWSDTGGDYFELVAVVAVLLAAFTVAVPVLHRMSREEERGPRGLRVRFCPSCGGALAGSAGVRLRCPACGAAVSVRFLGDQ